MRRRVPTLLTLALALALPACEDGLRCGAGTVALGGVCTLGADACGPGTALEAGRCLLDLDRLCGAGTQPVDGQCRGTLTCGAGTREDAGACVPAAPALICGAGTVARDGACQVAEPLVCGEGTAAVDGACRPTADPLICGEGAEIRGGVCVPVEVPPPCGEGTQAVEGECVAVPLPPPCAQGTVPQAGECVPHPDLATCGEGTVREGDACVPAPQPPPCGEGTVLADGECVAVAQDPRCGPGTVVQDDQCVPGAAACGPGTVAAEGQCVASAAACGPGTAFVDGQCRAAGLACGAGTVERDGACVAAADPLICGQGTVARDGACVPAAEPLICGPGTVEREGACAPADLHWVALPFPAGTEITVSQGHFGYFSHAGQTAYAVDFPTAEGSPVVAARGGTVQAVKADSNQGCAEPRCASLGNFIQIDHGDGTFGSYYHLRQGGALVAPGDVVCAGQPIGFTGNTGFTSGPHLHFAVLDPRGYSHPVRFQGLANESGGVLHAGRTYVSNTAAPAACDQAPAWSDCPADLFGHLGVQLQPGVPCSVGPAGQAVALRGQVTAPGRRLLIAQYDLARGAFNYRCEAPGPGGWFDTELRFFDQAFTYLVLAAAGPGPDCAAVQGWDTSPYVRLE